MDRAKRSFPLGSSGGPDGISAQHLRDLLSDATDDILRTSITDLVNILLAGDLPGEVTEITFRGRLLALEKKGGGIRPISVGYT